MVAQGEAKPKASETLGMRGQMDLSPVGLRRERYFRFTIWGLHNLEVMKEARLPR
jgi:hypothetical protein